MNHWLIWITNCAKPYRQEFRGLFKKSQATVIYSSTEPEEALAMGGQIAILNQGRLLQTGVTRHLYDHPATIGSAGFLAVHQ